MTDSKRPNMLFLSFMTALLLISCAPAATQVTKEPTAKATTVAGAPTAKPAASPEVKQGAETPRYGGVLTAYITGNPPSLDPQQESTINTSLIVTPIYSNLVQADPLTADKFVPGLAERWEMSPDGLTWTFDIRQGVKWHDSTPFTEDDAVFNLKRMTDPPKGVISNMSSMLKPVVKSVEKQGNKVKVNLNYPFAIMLDIVRHNFFPFVSEKYIEKNGDMKTTAMGTGPFKFKSYTPGVSFEATKNPDFWVKGRPYLDGYRYLILRDESTQLSAFRTAKVNMTGKGFATFRPNQMELIKKESPGVKLERSPSALGSWFFMNVRKPPFQDQRVRKAISLALDRQAALKVVAQGYGVISKPFLPPWGIPADELAKLPGYRQPKDADIAEARKLMGEAGYPNGFELVINSRRMWQANDAAVFMTSQLSPLGIKAKVQVLEDAIFWETGRKLGHEVMVYTPSWPFTDPQWQGRYWSPGGSMNYTGNDDDRELNQLWEDQIKIVDPEKRKAAIRRIEELLLEVLPGISIVWYDQFIGIHPEVKNFTAGISDYVGNTLEEIWLAK